MLWLLALKKSYIFPEEEVPEDNLIVITNEHDRLGSIRILDKAVMERIYAKYGPFYIIPTTVHDCLAFVKRETDQRTDLELSDNQYRQNQTVSPTERMSNDLYRFDGQKIHTVMSEE